MFTNFWHAWVCSRFRTEMIEHSQMMIIWALPNLLTYTYPHFKNTLCEMYVCRHFTIPNCFIHIIHPHASTFTSIFTSFLEQHLHQLYQWMQLPSEWWVMIIFQCITVSHIMLQLGLLSCPLKHWGLMPSCFFLAWSMLLLAISVLFAKTQTLDHLPVLAHLPFYPTPTTRIIHPILFFIHDDVHIIVYIVLMNILLHIPIKNLMQVLTAIDYHISKFTLSFRNFIWMQSHNH